MRQVIKHRDIRLLNMIRRTDPVILESLSVYVRDLSPDILATSCQDEYAEEACLCPFDNWEVILHQFFA